MAQIFTHITFPTIADFRAFPSSVLVNNETLILSGDASVLDGKPGLYTYSTSATNTDDGFLYLKPTDISGANPGRAVRQTWFDNVQADWNESDTDAPSFINNKPTVPQSASQSSVTPTLDTPTTIHATRNCLVNYCVSISVTSTLLGTNSGSVFLEISPDGSTGWVTIGKAGTSLSGVVSTVINTYMMPGEVPAGYYYRLRTSSTGTNGATYNSLAGQQVLI